MGGQLNFANDVFVEGARLNQRRRVGGDSGAYYDEILPTEGALAMPARFHRNALVEQHRNLVFQLILGLRVRNSNPRAFSLQKESGGDPRFTEADHQHAFVVYIHKT